MALEHWIIAPGQSKVIDIELVRSLKVSLIGGKVDVIAHDEPGARVEVAGVTGKDLKVEIDGDRLIVDHPQLRWENWLDVFRGFRGNAKAEVSILAPRHVLLKLGMVSGDALVSGFVGDAKLSTVSGELTVDRHVGDLELNGVSGELSAGNHVGGVNANTVSGDVIASGDLTKFTADGVSGNMIVDSVGTPRRIDTNTVSGDLTVRYTGGDGARVRVNSVSGTVLLEDASVRSIFGKGFERIIGTLDGDWLDLNANSVSGDISVIRREPRVDAASTATPGASASGAPTASTPEASTTAGADA
ncbi:DUF4097 family beta strand repeat-containing protein [Agromyces archimandritae]|uniref:DUF4097 domain-containing protein n=1 Tax=Agromyces archimandritae TaxID=2781962 RepID=A0A975FQ64_9MICO|nr:DUF4097 family beta strand repeat-containing protein [Agromyces archimandritae]QTX05792.1 hypothetical protein G127AT_06200 [Agromyces archimandritae]